MRNQAGGPRLSAPALKTLADKNHPPAADSLLALSGSPCFSGLLYEVKLTVPALTVLVQSADVQCLLGLSCLATLAVLLKSWSLTNTCLGVSYSVSLLNHFNCRYLK